MIGYAAILCVALMLNTRDSKMLALTLLVAAGIFAPIPDAYFYLVCMLIELLIALVAYKIAAPASQMIVRVSMMLVCLHALGWWLDGYPETSPYHAGVKCLEYAELVLCCLFSRPILARFSYV